MPDDSGVTLEYSSGHERLRLEAWGDDSIRVRAGPSSDSGGAPGRAHRTSPGSLSRRKQQRDHAHQREAESSRSPPTDW